LGGPPLLLFYRRDIFERLEVQPPRTWAEYFQASERLASRERVKEFLTSPDAKWFGTCEPLKGQWAAQIVLARAAPYAKHRSQFSAIFDYRTMNPLVDGPPFARALRELVDASRFFPAEATQCSPSDAVKLLHDGQCAMAIGWLADTKDWPAVTSPTPSLDIGVVPLPGSADVYNFRSAAWEQRGNEESHYVPLIGVSGRLGSLTKECRQPAAATRLLTWLSSPEMSVQISSASSSTGPFRESHLTQVKHWTGPLLSAEIVSRYAEAIRQSLSEPNCLCGLRIPRHQEYLSALSDATRSVVSGNAAAEVSLQEVAKRWNEITESSDREKQRHAYMRSIGLKP
jgi:multiple sugar transport system substrate-binding protein